MFKKLRRRLSRLGLVLWPLIPVFLIAGLFFYLRQSNFFTIKKINCQLSDLPCPLELEAVLIKLRGQNIFALSKSNLTNQLVQINSNFSDISIKKILPSTISINLNLRQSIAQITSVVDLNFTGLDSSQSATLSGQITNQIFLLDADGTIFNQTDVIYPDLPQVFVPVSFNLSLGQSDLTKSLSQLIERLKVHFLLFETITWINPEFVIIKTIPGSFVIFDLTQSLESQVASLQYILAGIKIEEIVPTKIDLRFDKPVLTY